MYYKKVLGILIGLCVLLFACTFLVQANAQETRWERYEFVTKWGNFGTGDGQFNRPRGVAIDSSGNVYVVDEQNHRVQKFSSDGAYITKWGGEG